MPALECASAGGLPEDEQWALREVEAQLAISARAAAAAAAEARSACALQLAIPIPRKAAPAMYSPGCRARRASTSSSRLPWP